MSILLKLGESLLAIGGFSYFYFKLILPNFAFKLKIFLIYSLGILGLILIKDKHLLWIEYLLIFSLIFFLGKVRKIKFKKFLFYFFISFLYGFLLSIFLIILFAKISTFFNIPFRFDNFTISYINLAISLILFILAKYTKLIHFINFFYENNYFDYILVVIILIIIFGFKKGLLLIFSIMFLIGIFLKYKVREKEINKYLKILKTNNEFYLKKEDESRILKHNLIARLLSIKSVSNDKAKILIDDLIKEYNKSINISYKITRIPFGLEGIIYEQTCNYLNKIDIKIYNNIKSNIYEILPPRKYNVLVEKLVILLDNAIEACLNSEEKVLIINLEEDINDITLEIKNTFSNLIAIDELGFKNYSTKGKMHGIGLFSILRDKEVLLKIKIVNNFFIAKITTHKK